MDLKTDMRIEINNSIPNEIIDTAVKVAKKHIEFEKLIAVQEYLLERGSNDEGINEKIREFKMI